MKTILVRTAIAACASFALNIAHASTPPVAASTTTMERRLDHQLNKHVTFPLDGAAGLDGAVLVSFVVDIEGRVKVVDAEGTNPALIDHILRQLERVDIGDNPNGTWKIERRRFVFRPEA